MFGEIINDNMFKNDYGCIVHGEWLRSGSIREELILDIFIVMPNHIHGIIAIDDVDHDSSNMTGAHGRAPLHRKPRSLGSFIAGFKARAAKRINELRGSPGAPVWQRNYYEHVIRSSRALEKVREYIETNPLRWALDLENPVGIGGDDYTKWINNLHDL